MTKRSKVDRLWICVVQDGKVRRAQCVVVPPEQVERVRELMASQEKTPASSTIAVLT